ncbi:Clavaminate synthase-like protein [Clavulina sp. PMI_390]|nr:Clavaminate synthase-like protein [Clavulina sp. PMI_390]
MKRGEDGPMLEWLENVNKWGFCFVKGVPATPEATQELIERIAFIRVTHYGGFWDFTADLAHGDTAYTNLALKAHTDSTYFTDPCGLQIFHLLSHTEGAGGESLLVDGFRAATLLGQANPAHLDVLARTKVPTHAVGDAEYHFMMPEERGNRIVELSQDGSEPVRVAYNNDDRGTIRGKKTVEELDTW